VTGLAEHDRRRRPARQAPREPAASNAAELSLRSRKKTRTRQQIADAAASLFATRGYDAVTVTDVARLAEVSEQTVYNFFSSKEKLVLDEDAAFEARLVALIRDRPVGSSVAEAVHEGAHAFLDELNRRPLTPQSKGGLPYLINTSPTLRRAWLEAVDRYADSIARVLREDNRDALSAPAAKVLGCTIVSVFAAILDEVGRGTKEGADLRRVIKTLRPQVDEALERIAPGLNSLRG
jgi:AcrR family transcriptional regulator